MGHTFESCPGYKAYATERTPLYRGVCCFIDDIIEKLFIEETIFKLIIKVVKVGSKSW